jgi:BirA family transcriptional regulator, biotin operon repressor / biotin---[acetyl-CoA-carboxylase] ligase
LNPETLLRKLADGEAHSGEALARELGITRAAVWKHVAKLGEWGLEVRGTPGRGYRLDRRVDLLDRARIGRFRDPRVAAIEVFTQLGSTNRYLLDQPPPLGRMNACVAEFQTSGRGRRGRRWLAPLASGLCLSVGWRFAETPLALTALTLAIGVVVRRVVAAATGIALDLKWPNDLVWRGAKIGGILVELSAEAHGGCHVVAGLGLNVALPDAALVGLSDWPGGATDLARALGREPPSRTDLTLALIGALTDLLTSYSQAGFAPYREEWRTADFLDGLPVRCSDFTGSLRAIARGIDEDGALLVETADGARRRMISGDVSLRPAE